METIADELSSAIDLSCEAATAAVRTLLAEWEADGGCNCERTGAAQSILADHPQPVKPAPARRYLIVDRVFEITINDERVRSHVEATLEPFLAMYGDRSWGANRTRVDLTVNNGSEPYALHVDGVERLRATTPSEAAGAVFQHMLQAFWPGMSWLALIHGASVSSSDGRSIIFAGAGGSGKSTLAAILSRRGYGFLTDDMVALRAPEGAVVPWPLPHSLKRGSWRALAALYPELAAAPISRIHDRDVRFVAARAEDWTQSMAPVAAIVFPRFVSDGEDAIETLTTFEALKRLIDDRLWLGEKLTVSAVEAFVRWLERIPAFAIRYSSSAGAERLIRSALD